MEMALTVGAIHFQRLHGRTFHLRKWVASECREHFMQAAIRA